MISSCCCCSPFWIDSHYYSHWLKDLLYILGPATQGMQWWIAAFWRVEWMMVWRCAPLRWCVADPFIITRQLKTPLFLLYQYQFHSTSSVQIVMGVVSPFVLHNIIARRWKSFWLDEHMHWRWNDWRFGNGVATAAARRHHGAHQRTRQWPVLFTMYTDI